MRVPLLAALLASTALVLGGCGPSPQNSELATALTAYQNADLPAFDAEVAKADAAAAAAKSLDGYETACTEQAASARRAVVLANELHGLDSSTVFSLSEEARMVFMWADFGAAQTYLVYTQAPKDCVKTTPQVGLADGFERDAWVSVYQSRLEAWRSALKARSPADYSSRLDEAQSQLERAGLGTFTRWGRGGE